MASSTTRSLALAGAGAVAGAAIWSATEYAVHRWLLHGPFGSGRLSRIPIGGIHRNHHADPDHTVALGRLAGHAAMAGTGLAAGSLLARVVPRTLAFAAGTTWSSGYSTYDLVHWAAHHRPPRTAAGRRLRQRHFRHHYGAPKGNLGVTMAWWDHLLGTEVPDRDVTVPSKFAPEWLDELGPRFRSGVASPT